MRGEVLDGGDEVGEGVALLHEAAGIVPGLAHVAAAADVRVGHDDAAIEQAEAVAVEADGQRVAVGAVGVDVQGIRCPSSCRGDRRWRRGCCVPSSAVAKTRSEA